MLMPRIRRRFLIDPAEVGVYHCINRCVRRSFLCGFDQATGRNYDHRKQWIQDRMQFLAGQFGVDVLGFAVMSNHLHVVLRNRPDVIQNWSDAEMARRWWNLFPKRRDREGHPQEPTGSELRMITFDAAQLAEIRQRLSSVSWFMRCLVEPMSPILERLHMSEEGWMQLMGQFSRLFRRAAGRPQSMQREREQRGCRLMQGIRHSRAIFF